MKRLHLFTVILVCYIFLGACKGGTGKTKASDSANATRDITNVGGVSIDSAENISGSNLIAANDCFTCHDINKKSVGPSYMQVAKQYDINQGNIENLANKIRKGGGGLWGNNSMNPHPDLSEPQARLMAHYILSLDAADTSK